MSLQRANTFAFPQSFNKQPEIVPKGIPARLKRHVPKKMLRSTQSHNALGDMKHHTLPFVPEVSVEEEDPTERKIQDRLKMQKEMDLITKRVEKVVNKWRGSETEIVEEDQNIRLEASKGKVKVLFLDYEGLGLTRNEMLTNLKNWFEKVKSDKEMSEAGILPDPETEGLIKETSVAAEEFRKQTQPILSKFKTAMAKLRSAFET